MPLGELIVPINFQTREASPVKPVAQEPSRTRRKASSGNEFPTGPQQTQQDEGVKTLPGGGGERIDGTPSVAGGPEPGDNKFQGSEFKAQGSEFGRNLLIAAIKRKVPDLTPREDQVIHRTDRLQFIPFELIPPEYRDEVGMSAYLDQAIMLRQGISISQPSTVAFMTSLAELTGGKNVMEIGTASGYQAAILSQLVNEGEVHGTVHTIESDWDFAIHARDTLLRLNYTNVTVYRGDGAKGIPIAAPYDVIIATAAVTDIPAKWIEQLAPLGKIITPMGPHPERVQLVVATKQKDDSLHIEKLPYQFIFVPIISSEAGAFRITPSNMVLPVNEQRIGEALQVEIEEALGRSETVIVDRKHPLIVTGQPLDRYTVHLAKPEGIAYVYEKQINNGIGRFGNIELIRG